MIPLQEPEPVADVEIYTTPFCPYCHRAKNLLKQKGVDYTEHDVMMAFNKRAEMRDRAGGRNSVPQIFINGRHIGGSDDLIALDDKGELDPLLKEDALRDAGS
jgi:glutaredoxin 3